MSEVVNNQSAEIPVEAILRSELAHGDALLGTIGPILGHLVINAQNQLFSDEIVAHIRGMAGSVATQFLAAQSKASEESVEFAVQKGRDALVSDLLASEGFLSHCHALTIERALAEKLHDRSAIDLVLSPMLQALVSSDDPNTSSSAMAVLTAQARFIQQQRRMELPVTELPGEVFHAAILTWRMSAGEGTEEITSRAEMDLRSQFDEATSRLGQLLRVVSGMGSGARAALSVSHAGVAIFLTALAHLSHQQRDVAVLSTNERQLGRLALALRSTGLKTQEVEEQFLYLHPEIALPEGFEMLRSDRAREMLSSASGLAAGSDA